MDELTQKSKDEVAKMLSSKHLFFREMCAKHNSAAADATAAGVEATACIHHPSPASMAAASFAAAAPSLGMKDSSAGPEDDSEVVPRSNNVDDEVGLGMKSRWIYGGGGNDAPAASRVRSTRPQRPALALSFSVLTSIST